MLVAALLSVACQARPSVADPPASADQPRPRVANPGPAPSPEPKTIGPCALHAAGLRGLVCLDDQAQPLGTLFDTPLDDATFADANTIVAWSTATERVYFLDATTAAVLDSIDLLPTLPDCDRATLWPTVAVSAWLPSPTDPLCLELANGACQELEDLRITAHIDLRKHAIDFTRVWDDSPCTHVVAEGHQCPTPQPIEVAPDQQHPYFLANASLFLWRESKTPERIWGPISPAKPRERNFNELDPIHVGLASFAPVAITSSGRWLILLGNHFKGDVGHLQALLLDRTTGQLFAIPKTPTTTWPDPLDPDQLAQLGDGDESMWLFHDDRPRLLPDHDRFALGNYLINPGTTVTRLPGHLVVAP